MSKTNLHKLKGKFNNGLLEEIPIELERHFDRHNKDKGEFRKLKKRTTRKNRQKKN